MIRSDAVDLDARDPLRFVAQRFVIPDAVLYLDGNSLGMLPRGVSSRITDLIERQWGQDLIRSWNTNGWIGASRRVGDRIATLIGADAGEVLAADSTSVNLYKILVAAVRMRPGRTAMVTDADNFPSDRYLMASVAEQFGLTLRFADVASLASAIDDDVAVVSLTHVDYRSGLIHPMADITQVVQNAGALMIWDLAHSAGVLDLDISNVGVDFAVGCGYKYLNGGPGAPGYLYVASRHQDDFRQPLTGWLGHARPFAMSAEYEPAMGIDRAIVGTPNMLSLIALEAALDAFDGLAMADVRARSSALTQLMIELVEERCPNLVLASPRDAAMRGSQVSYRHPDAFAVMQALIARGVVGDFREPDNIRFGLSPLYTRFTDVWDAVNHLHEVLTSESWRDPAFAVRGAVV